MATLQPLELSSSSTIFSFLSKSSCGYLHNMSTLVLNSSPFPESPCGVHCAQILSIPANHLSLKIILCSYGSESLEEHIWKLLWCTGTILVRVPSMDSGAQWRDSGKEFANALKGSIFVSPEVCSDRLPMINDCHLLAWEKRPFWATFLKAVKAQGDEKTFHTSLLLCDQKLPDLSLAMSTHFGKVCEDFIMNQTMILKI